MIQATKITKKFEKFTALDGISCSMPTGCVYGMVGSNGAGKSTFLRILTGIYRQNDGEVLFDGKPVWNNPEVKSKIAFVPDELYFSTGSTLKTMMTQYCCVYESFDEKKCLELQKKLDLPLKKPLSQFSKGMRRQAAVILELSRNPQYAFFDETFDGLDPIMRNYVKQMILDETMERNIHVVVTSHSLRELEDLCDQLALLHKGGLILESDVEKLKTAHFKVQIALRSDYNEETFHKVGITPIQFSKTGSVANMILDGDMADIQQKLQTMQPILLDILPLTLDEVFRYEMEALGYQFEGE